MQRRNAFQKCHPACLFGRLFRVLIMTKEQYRQERLDPRWQKKRLEIMQRDEFKCRDCEGEKETLNVHHGYYVKGRKCWNYPSFALETLCRECHQKRHLPLSDDEIEGISEWEESTDLILSGTPDAGINGAWDLGMEISFCSDVIGRNETFSALLHFLHSLRKDASK